VANLITTSEKKNYSLYYYSHSVRLPQSQGFSRLVLLELESINLVMDDRFLSIVRFLSTIKETLLNI
jgi:hypothetical protein